MKVWLKHSSMPLAMAIYAAFIVLFLCTFDSYSLAFISPETPFMKIAEIPFHRVEFITLLFSLTFGIGVVAGVLLKDKVNRLLPLCAVILGSLTLFIGLLDVDLVQQLMPMTRISHIIMTVSRLTGIMLGISGLFIGISSSALIKSGKYLLIGVVVGGVLSVFAEATKAYNTIYMFFGLAIIAVAVALQLFKTENKPISYNKLNFTSNIFCYSNAFLTSGALTFFAIVGYIYFKFSLNESTMVYLITIASSLALFIMFSKLNFNNLTKIILGIINLALWFTAIILPNTTITIFAVMFSFSLLGGCRIASSNSNFTLLFSAFGSFIFTIIACLVNHLLSEVIKYSGNRVIYQVSEYAWIVFIAITAIVVFISIFINSKKRKKIEINK